MSLVDYHRKRNFKKTSEPIGQRAQSGQSRFVIQKHAASRLHYDFRLELGGVLKSWAVPKGVPYAKGQKHLAVQVEDHPLSYIDFEGTIPKGQYGGGTVMVWDHGNYESLSGSPEKALSEGKLHFILRGRKLQGEWYLVRLRDGNNWLLVRGRNDLRPPTQAREDASAISGRSMKAIARTDVVWNATPEKAQSSELEIDGVKLRVSNLNKVLYPKTGFAKGEVIDFYIRISEVLLPHLKDRPLVLKRYPNGVDESFFYEKQCPAGHPKWIKTARVPKLDGTFINYCLVNNLPALVWAANLADLELHTFLHKAPAIERPTALALDLDPGPPADILTCGKVALHLKDALAGLKLKSFPKTSGSKGMQVYVPLNTPATYEQTKAFAHELASWFEREYPALAVSKMAKRHRSGKVFMDWSQNDDKKTTINVYSLRGMARPIVSTPLTWDEVEDAVNSRNAARLIFEAADVLERVEKLGDLFAPVLTLKQRLPRRAA